MSEQRGGGVARVLGGYFSVLGSGGDVTREL